MMDLAIDHTIMLFVILIIGGMGGMGGTRWVNTEQMPGDVYLISPSLPALLILIARQNPNWESWLVQFTSYSIKSGNWHFNVWYVAFLHKATVIEYTWNPGALCDPGVCHTPGSSEVQLMSLLLIMTSSESLQPVATLEKTVIFVFRPIIIYSKHQRSIVYVQSCSGSTVKILFSQELAFLLNYSI